LLPVNPRKRNVKPTNNYKTHYSFLEEENLPFKYTYSLMEIDELQRYIRILNEEKYGLKTKQSTNKLSTYKTEPVEHKRIFSNNI
jgi:hypothetical protein